jgi:hypothetical protein
MKKTKMLLYVLGISLIFGFGVSCNREEFKMNSSENDDLSFLKMDESEFLGFKIKRAVNKRDIQYAQGSVEGFDEERTTFDIFIPKKDPEIAKPLVIYVHGGGFTDGDKDEFYTPARIQDIQTYIDSGIAFANVNYRLESDFATDTSDAPPAEREDILLSMKDVKRCLQFIRKNFASFNIIKTKIAMYGSSAGGGCTIWLGCSDDMKNINDPDPVFRQSTRLFAMGHLNSQATYNPSSFYNVFPSHIDCNILNQLVGNCSACYAVDPPKTCYNFPQLSESWPELDFLNFMTSDDPEMYIQNLQGISDVNDDCEICIDYVHSPFHAKALHEKANQVGISVKSNVPAFGINTTDGDSFVQYIIKKLTLQ